MNSAFLTELMERTGFPSRARAELLNLAEGLEAEMDRLVDVFLSTKSHEGTNPLIEQLAEKRGVSPYSIWLVVLILAAEGARPLYRDEKVFFDTFSDLRCKALECFERYGIWGTFVAHWYPRFYMGKIVKLGRMEYETRIYEGKAPVTLMGLTLNPGEPLLYLHIPSSGEPFDRETRMESYRMACAYFGKPLVCLCSSWMLYPGYGPLLPEGSNIGDFQKDFYLISHEEKKAFNDGWRIFGAAWGGPLEALPEKTHLQRIFKAHLLQGGTVGTGTGVLIFDGKRLLSRQEDET